ncbi:hypothetical protein OBBRIDRAFT_416263 [Obba rivulosa]|uniref:Uncharacterized protein n=1 Tax=Obba rivulosa TaxID=1052685 RepID=A0A8E2DME3_9APHY|nr:hypothetical protein OBBRIDRAFT_416263 [Obba rivulosa]
MYFGSQASCVYSTCETGNPVGSPETPARYLRLLCNPPYNSATYIYMRFPFRRTPDFFHQHQPNEATSQVADRLDIVRGLRWLYCARVSFFRSPDGSHPNRGPWIRGSSEKASEDPFRSNTRRPSEDSLELCRTLTASLEHILGSIAATQSDQESDANRQETVPHDVDVKSWVEVLAKTRRDSSSMLTMEIARRRNQFSRNVSITS